MNTKKQFITQNHPTLIRKSIYSSGEKQFLRIKLNFKGLMKTHITTHLERLSSRIFCSSVLQFLEIPGLCFIAVLELSCGATVPKFPLAATVSKFKFLPLNEEEAWFCSCSWWFPEGLAINIRPFSSKLNAKTLNHVPNQKIFTWFPPIPKLH